MRLVPDESWAILTICGEARGEPREGQLGVAEVIRNRMRRRYQSDGTVVGTVLRPQQFSCWNASDPNRRIVAVLDAEAPIVTVAREVWAQALAGSETVGGAVLYLNRSALQVLPPWVEETTLLATVGHHEFYGAV